MGQSGTIEFRSLRDVETFLRTHHSFVFIMARGSIEYILEWHKGKGWRWVKRDNPGLFGDKYRDGNFVGRKIYYKEWYVLMPERYLRKEKSKELNIFEVV